MISGARFYSRCARSQRSGQRGHGLRYYEASQLSRRFVFSSTAPLHEDASKSEGKTKKKDLRESIERMKGEGGGSKNADANNEQGGGEGSPHVERLASVGASFLSALSDTWEELLASGRAGDINKKIGTPKSKGGDSKPNYADDDEAADKYEKWKGSSAIMVIDPEEHLSAWERMERRLRDAPIIQGE